jgi:D-alanyl-lipoteichoic acid acyltransferase DltB (MBOAT superfamily)
MNFDLSLINKWLTYNPSEPMIFQSIEFFILFTVFYLLFSVFYKSIHVRNSLLLLFCLFFYYKISGYFVFILIGMAFFDFIIAKSIHRTRKDFYKKLFLFCSFLMNVGALIYFKYTYFFINLINDVSHSNISLTFKILQPIGISYFVFKSLSYVIDVSREVIEEPENDFKNYLVYVSFFPNILAGPITKARDLLPQLNSIKLITSKQIKLAVYLISLGLVKKIAVADFIAANFSDRVFESPQFFSSIDLFMSSYAGLLHLYFDFSGYTDLVVGLATLLGFEIAGNFNQPFKAKNISDFWKRWHISLYLWLSDYVHQPIAFALRKYKKIGAIIAIFSTFFISGLWHGANLTFVIWGILHGTAIVIEIISQKTRSQLSNKFKHAYVFLSIFLTFNFIAFSSVLINSPNILFAFNFYHKMFVDVDFGLFSKWLSIYYTPFTIMIVALILQYLPISWYSFLYKHYNKLPLFIVSTLFGILLIVLYQIASEDSLPFIYIEF